MRSEARKLGLRTRRAIDNADLSLLQVAQATVNQARGTAACAACKISLLDERDAQAQARCVTGDSRARDSSADDEHVETFMPRALETLLSPRARDLRKEEFFAHRISVFPQTRAWLRACGRECMCRGACARKSHCLTFQTATIQIDEEAQLPL